MDFVICDWDFLKENENVYKTPNHHDTLYDFIAFQVGQKIYWYVDTKCDF